MDRLKENLISGKNKVKESGEQHLHAYDENKDIDSIVESENPTVNLGDTLLE